MHTKRSFSNLGAGALFFVFVAAGTVSLVQAQEVTKASSDLRPPLFLASSAPLDVLTSSTPTYSSSADPLETLDDASMNFSNATDDGGQPPPRRRYGRPNYSDSHTNADGSSRYTFMGGIGMTPPIENTHKYYTPSYGFQVGAGRNFNQRSAVMLQFDYDHLGLQGNTIANQAYIYNYGCTPAFVAAGQCSLVTGLDGNAHIWSFTIDPTLNFPSAGNVGAYLVVGGGFYHKVTNFTLPGSQCGDPYCIYQYTVNQNVDHYSSNSVGANGGFGLTYKFSKFSNERFYVEGRYVLMVNSQRHGYTSQNVGTLNSNTTDFYPANSNRTTWVPIKVGIRF